MNVIKKIRSEHEEQVSLFIWAGIMASEYPELNFLYAIPNGAKRPHNITRKGEKFCSIGQKLKKEGVKSGVPDVCLPAAKGRYHGLYIEMKRWGGKISEKQKKWLQFLAQQNYYSVVCQGANAAQQVLLKYLQLDEHQSLKF